MGVGGYCKISGVKRHFAFVSFCGSSYQAGLFGVFLLIIYSPKKNHISTRLTNV